VLVYWNENISLSVKFIACCERKKSAGKSQCQLQRVFFKLTVAKICAFKHSFVQLAFLTMTKIRHFWVASNSREPMQTIKTM
jgi:hypothetical protein